MDPPAWNNANDVVLKSSSSSVVMPATRGSSKTSSGHGPPPLPIHQSPSRAGARKLDRVSASVPHDHDVDSSIAGPSSWTLPNDPTELDALLGDSATHREPARNHDRANMGKFVGRLRYALGIFFLLCVVGLWVGSSFLMNYLFADDQYFKPFFVTYLNTSTFSVYLLFFAAGALFGRGKKPTAAHGDAGLSVRTADASAETIAAEGEKPKVEGHVAASAPTGAAGVDLEEEGEVLGFRATAWISFQFCWLWFVANYTSNMALGYTNVASVTILSSMSGPLTLILAPWFGADSFTLVKVVAVAVSFGGVVCVGLSDSSSGTGTNPFLGDLLALLGAVFYAFYITFMKRKVGHESRINMRLFFGLVGVFNAVLLLPLLALASFAGLETFEMPAVGQWKYLLINAFFGTFLSDYLWLLSMLMTGPVVVTLGLSLTTPVAMIGDSILHHMTYSGLYITGAVLIILGFLGVNLEFPTIDAAIARRWNRFRGRPATEPSPL
ncbi:hypothetical protein AMAG_02835 [Allomyces macrogynus ATCC 38327]|uniref:EamA domain-containing protein n=1 Tax=Allomyces macrogynus (strain ATCC 38327) TaxID=578462 RepID=A0A0L0S3V1_ALLM3|nr:hypothetical protein AMAG_02835 [Allomyces macrogynus ATCC 38327]|eukprot:KNE57081.1 hypothetical protein AMAG_02835 [Allomyces macrogynus ATCC 38327]